MSTGIPPVHKSVPPQEEDFEDLFDDEDISFWAYKKKLIKKLIIKAFEGFFIGFGITCMVWYLIKVFLIEL